ncbi:winged helix-turn-helix domain-containing protein [Halobellus inordinatus]|uniref:winged helix-turn-helix domain-containing protein n=1 Tax=Halobellus inordinatus TaxID=1126236 RepID=UPI00210C49DB|nr:helix-turn-helix domain-containing protein [Halobellus inordinatus]
MTLWDDRILEIINDEGSGTATELADHRYIRVSRSQISRRLKKLAEHGLLQPLGNGVYVITDTGEDYLEGELDAGQLPEADEEPESSTA